MLLFNCNKRVYHKTLITVKFNIKIYVLNKKKTRLLHILANILNQNHAQMTVLELKYFELAIHISNIGILDLKK